MFLTQRHYISRSHELFEEADRLSFFSKNLYNTVLYETRQKFFTGELSLARTYWQHYFVVTRNEAFYELSSKAAQGVVHQVLRDWKSYFTALVAYKKSPTKFKAAPKIPRYKDKLKGRNALFFPDEAINKTNLKRGVVQPHKTNLEISSRIPAKLLRQVRLIPDNDGYWLEVVYDASDKQLKTIVGSNAAGMDIGANNLAAVVTNYRGETPLLINGRPLKAINQHYNKRLAAQKSQWDVFRRHLEKRTDHTTMIRDTIPTEAIKGFPATYPYYTRRTRRTTHKRNMQVNNYLHHVSTYLVKYFASKSVSTVVVGKNNDWKQATRMGARNNQNFVQIPFTKFIGQLEYKCSLSGITLLTVEEGYTSKCSFLDGEVCQKKAEGTYLGKRVKRGLFRAANGQLIHADINAAANILTKVVPTAFEASGIAGVLVRPRKITLSVIHAPKGVKKSEGSN